ncbi:MAG TPA: phospho-N-acetylmuramoyl-pentapeptide-transferase, partial [bacterium]|nr:phospho-N-acetylmuramoyl-pentapeptide-transferase [bacterium]
MFYFVYEWLFDSYSYMRVFSYITVRAGFALITAILLSIIFGNKFIKKLIEMKMGQPIREDHFHKLNQTKANTPTMGGILMIFSIVISTLIWGNLYNRYVILCLITFVALAAVGFIDDYLKLKYKTSKGGSGKTELFLQCLIAFSVGWYLYQT